MKKIICLFIVAGFISCNNSSDQSPAKLPDSDSTGIVNKSHAAAFDETLFKELHLPLKLDTSFVSSADTNDRITFEQVRGLKSLFLADSIADGLPYQLEAFCKIDSMKRNNTYGEYVNKLDIGMTKNSIAFKIGHIALNKNSKLFLWGIEYGSYEACPFFSGKSILATYVNSKNENITFVLAERSGGGDPPSVGDTDITSLLKQDGTIEIMNESVIDDLDIPGEEQTIVKYLLSVENETIKVKDYRKQINNTETAQP